MNENASVKESMHPILSRLLQKIDRGIRLVHG